MKSYVADLEVNVEVLSYFLAMDVQLRRTKSDKPYLVFKLGDKTGQVDGRLWEVKEDVLPLSGAFLKIRGDVSEWGGEKQITIRQMKAVSVNEFAAAGLELGDFLERSERDPKEMWEELNSLLGEHLNDFYLDSLVGEILSQNRIAFCEAPAGKTIHHNYVGGLLEHVLSLCNLALLTSPLYGLNLDFMLTACCLHDIGKLRELSYGLAIGYTVEGTLLGHIVIGMQMVSEAMEKIPSFPSKYKMMVLHMIASHHGLLEYGSPKIPLMKEAIGFHIFDMLDSRMAICDRTIKKGIDENGLTEWSKELGGPLYKLTSNDKLIEFKEKE